MIIIAILFSSVHTQSTKMTRGVKMLASWLLLLGPLALIPYGVEGKWGSNDPGKVLLRDVQVLTLKNGKMTTGRRSSPVPQLVRKSLILL